MKGNASIQDNPWSVPFCCQCRAGSSSACAMDGDCGPEDGVRAEANIVIELSAEVQEGWHVYGWLSYWRASASPRHTRCE